MACAKRVSQPAVRKLIKSCEKIATNANQSEGIRRSANIVGICVATDEEYRAVERAFVNERVYWDGGQSEFPPRETSPVERHPSIFRAFIVVRIRGGADNLTCGGNRLISIERELIGACDTGRINGIGTDVTKSVLTVRRDNYG